MAEKYDDVLAPFLTLMRRELHANSRKGDRPGWLAMDANTLLLDVYWHAAKLSAAVKHNDGPAIQEHSADVANMAMMVLDVCGGLAFVDADGSSIGGVAASDAMDAHQANGLAWAVSRWQAEVSQRPLVNVHRRTLDDTWRQVIRYFGGDPAKLLGPDHDTLLMRSRQTPAGVAVPAASVPDERDSKD